MPTGQVSRLHTRIITQPMATSGAVAKPNSSAPSSAGHGHVPARSSACRRPPCATRLRRPLQRQRLVRLRPRPAPRAAPRCGWSVRGAAPVPPSASGDENHLRAGLGHARGHGAHARLADQLDADARPAVGALEVVDQLRQILDGVDVVMGRRRDQRSRPAWSSGCGRPRDTPCRRADARPRRASRPEPSLI